MGLLDRLFGPQWAAVKELEARTAAALPPGWRYQFLEQQRLGTQQVKHTVWGAWAVTPEGAVIALANDASEALRALARAATEPGAPAAAWAPPAGRLDGRPRDPGARAGRLPADHAAQVDARDHVLSLLPAGSAVSHSDEEEVGPFRIHGVTAHLPDGTALAALATSAVEAHEALAARLRGELPVLPAWTLRRPSL